MSDQLNAPATTLDVSKAWSYTSTGPGQLYFTTERSILLAILVFNPLKHSGLYQLLTVWI
jgi:hypothetical protein